MSHRLSLSASQLTCCLAMGLHVYQLWCLNRCLFLCTRKLYYNHVVYTTKLTIQISYVLPIFMSWYSVKKQKYYYAYDFSVLNDVAVPCGKSSDSP